MSNSSGCRKVHLWTGHQVSTCPKWKSRPPNDPPWQQAACGVLGLEMVSNVNDVTCGLCKKTQAARFPNQRKILRVNKITHPRPKV